VGARDGGGHPRGAGLTPPDRRPASAEEQLREPRLFVAAALPEPAADAVRDLVARVQREVAAQVAEPRSEVRWVRLDGLHLTLRFLGPTPRDRVDAVAASVDATARGEPPIRVALSGAGAFPSPGRPRTLWLGVAEGADRLAGLARRLDGALEAAGWPPVDRPFRPHLTLARADGRREGPLVARRLADEAARLGVRFEVDRLVLYESVTGSGPARYVPLHEAALGEIAGS
jgi:2'-5' RNA ligase